MKTIIRDLSHLGSVLHQIAGAAQALICDGAVEITVKPAKKKRIQEEKYHAMIGDIVRHGEVKHNGRWCDFSLYEKPLKTGKALLVHWFETDLTQQGMRLKNPSRWIICPMTKTAVNERASTSEFGIKEAANFIEFLYSIGAENNIKWSEKVTVYDEYPEAQR